VKVAGSHLDALKAAAVERYEAEMVMHLTAYAPELARIAGRPALQQVVRAGVERAASFGFTNRGPVQLFLEMICSFGFAFDTDPQYPWAQAALSDPRTQGNQAGRAARLYEGAMDYFAHVAGPGNVHELAAIAKALETQTLGGSPGASLPDRILAWFRRCYPEKYEYVGEKALRTLTARSLDLAREHGLQMEDHCAAIAMTLFAFGHGALGDPLYPWIHGALTAPAAADPVSRAGRLINRLRMYAGEMAQTLA
jgi:hypothetical protein